MTDTISIKAWGGNQALFDANGISMIAPDQCRAARALLGWSAQQVADAGGIGIATIKRFESGQPVQMATVERVQACLEAAGMVFLEPGQPSVAGGAGVRLAKGVAG